MNVGNSAELIIRPAAGADLPRIARLAVADWGGEHAEWQARFARDLAEPDACLLLAETGGLLAETGGLLAETGGLLAETGGLLAETGGLLAGTGGQVVAYGRARRFDPPPDPPANIAPAGYYLAGLVVAPAYRRQGIGERLTQGRMAWTALRPQRYGFRQRGQPRIAAPAPGARFP